MGLLKNDPFHLIESDLIVAPIVELGGARALVRRHLLRVFEQPAVEQIDRDAGRPECVTAQLRDDPGRERPPHDHPPGVLPRHPRFRKLLAAAPADRAEQRRRFVGPDPGRGDIGVDITFEQVVRRHFVLLAAFFVQPHPPAFALRIIVFDVHVQRLGDAGEGVDQERDQRPVAQADDGRDVNAVEQFLRFVAVEHRGLAFLDDVLRPTHRGGRIRAGENLADDQPLEHHADRREMLLDGRLFEVLA